MAPIVSKERWLSFTVKTIKHQTNWQVFIPERSWLGDAASFDWAENTKDNVYLAHSLMQNWNTLKNTIALLWQVQSERVAWWERSTHEISEQVDIVFLNPVAEDLGGSVSLGEDELYEPGSLLLGRRLSLETAVFLVSCRLTGQQLLNPI